MADRNRFSAWLLAGSLLGAFLGPVDAATGSGAVHLAIPPDARTEGMGRAWAALSTSPNAAWSNVGGLALAPASGAVLTHSPLLEGLVSGVVHTYGAGLAAVRLDAWRLASALSYNHLDYGEVQATEAGSTDPFDTFRPYERSIGIAQAVGFTSESVQVGVGVGVKWIRVDLTHGLVGAEDAGLGESATFDMGALYSFRVLSDPDRSRTGRLLLGIGLSNLIGDITLGNSSRSEPPPKALRTSLGFEFTMGRAGEVIPGFGHPELPDLPLLSLDAALGIEKDLLEEGSPPGCPDDTTTTVGGEPCLPGDRSLWEQDSITRLYGLEVGFLGSLFGRWGHITDDVGRIRGSTYGAGISLLGLLGLDWASIPQAGDLDRVDKYSFWVRVPL